jgi:hypothetical protein
MTRYGPQLRQPLGEALLHGVRVATRRQPPVEERRVRGRVHRRRELRHERRQDEAVQKLGQHEDAFAGPLLFLRLRERQHNVPGGCRARGPPRSTARCAAWWGVHLRISCGPALYTAPRQAPLTRCLLPHYRGTAARAARVASRSVLPAPSSACGRRKPASSSERWAYWAACCRAGRHCSVITGVVARSKSSEPLGRQLK